MKDRYIVGIDPGQKGAIAFLGIKKLQVEVYDMPKNPADFLALIEPYAPYIIRVFIESQHPFPQQGLVSMGKLMRHYGELLGVLTALRISFEEISPRKWQREFLGNGRKRKRESKELSLAKAKQLFPTAEIGRKDGRADAILIAEYGRRLLVGKGGEK